jgi:hypothetical protein
VHCRGAAGDSAVQSDFVRRQRIRDLIGFGAN